MVNNLYAQTTTSYLNSIKAVKARIPAEFASFYAYLDALENLVVQKNNLEPVIKTYLEELTMTITTEEQRTHYKKTLLHQLIENRVMDLRRCFQPNTFANYADMQQGTFNPDAIFNDTTTSSALWRKRILSGLESTLTSTESQKKWLLDHMHTTYFPHRYAYFYGLIKLLHTGNHTPRVLDIGGGTGYMHLGVECVKAHSLAKQSKVLNGHLYRHIQMNRSRNGLDGESHRYLHSLKNFYGHYNQKHPYDDILGTGISPELTDLLLCDVPRIDTVTTDLSVHLPRNEVSVLSTSVKKEILFILSGLRPTASNAGHYEKGLYFLEALDRRYYPNCIAQPEIISPEKHYQLNMQDDNATALLHTIVTTDSINKFDFLTASYSLYQMGLNPTKHEDLQKINKLWGPFMNDGGYFFVLDPAISITGYEQYETPLLVYQYNATTQSFSILNDGKPIFCESPITHKITYYDQDFMDNHPLKSYTEMSVPYKLKNRDPQRGYYPRPFFINP